MHARTYTELCTSAISMCARSHIRTHTTHNNDNNNNRHPASSSSSTLAPSSRIIWDTDRVEQLRDAIIGESHYAIFIANSVNATATPPSVCRDACLAYVRRQSIFLKQILWFESNATDLWCNESRFCNNGFLIEISISFSLKWKIPRLLKLLRRRLGSYNIFCEFRTGPPPVMRPWGTTTINASNRLQSTADLKITSHFAKCMLVKLLSKYWT